MSEALLELAVEILGPLVEDVVFVGGATIHLWITEQAAPPVRATDDVDVICDVTSYTEYQALAKRLRERRLEEAINENVICRWRHREPASRSTSCPPRRMCSASPTPGTEPPWKPRSNAPSHRGPRSERSRHQDAVASYRAATAERAAIVTERIDTLVARLRLLPEA